MELPKQFIQSIQQVKGFNEEAFIQVHTTEQQVTSIRINPEKKNIVQHLPIESALPWCNNGYYLTHRPSFTLDPLFHAGTYYVQEASSMFLWKIMQQIFPSNTAKKVLDVCAAPGGKSTLLSSYFSNGLVVSNEVIKPRAAVLVENICKWGTNNVVVTNNDPKDFAALKGFFDAIVVDAPCSGSGMFRKDTTAINEWSLNNVNLCSSRQQRIVADVFEALKEDGFLVYSTCSYSKEENEDVVDWLIKTFQLKSINIQIEKDDGIVETTSDVSNAFGYRFYPYNIEGEGFFVAVLQKKTVVNEIKLQQQNILTTNKQEVSVIQTFIPHLPEVDLFKHNNQIRAIQYGYLNDIKTLANYLYIKKAGICLGEIKGKDFVPHHELAVSTFNLSNIASILFTKEQALQYLRKQEIAIELKTTGWALAVYEGVGLGWMKILPNRFNNYYPQEWRILKA